MPVTASNIIQRAAHGIGPFAQHMRINLGGSDVFVPQQFLQRTQYDLGELRRFRNYLVHGVEVPSAEALDAANARLVEAIQKKNSWMISIASKPVVLTNGFAKKTRKTPLQEIKLAEQRKQDYLSRKEEDAENDDK